MANKKILQAEEFYKQGQFPAAQTIFKQQLKRGVNPKEREIIFCRLGEMAVKQGDYAAGEHHFLQCVHMSPNAAYAHQNLLVAYVATKNYDKAVPHYKKLAELKPESDIPTRYGACLCDAGRLQEGLAQIKSQIHTPFGLENWAHFYQTTLPYENRLAFLAEHKDTILNQPETQDYIKCDILKDYAINIWGEGNAEAFTKAVNAFESMCERLNGTQLKGANATHQKSLGKIIKNIEGYRGFLKALTPYANLPADQPTQKPLYMLGDSHTLAAHNQTVQYSGEPRQLKARLHMGLSWNLLADETQQFQQAVFAQQVGHIANGEDVILSLGEIDCRHDGGMWPHHKKSGTPLEDILTATLPTAAAYLTEHQGDKHFTVTNIPTPSKHKEKLFKTLWPVEDWPAYAQMVKDANALWAQEADKHGWKILDLQALTETDDTLYIEDNHLKPEAIGLALAQL